MRILEKVDQDKDLNFFIKSIILVLIHECVQPCVITLCNAEMIANIYE